MIKYYMALHRVKNIIVITEQIITILFDRVLIVKYPMLPRAFVLTYKSSSQKPFSNIDSSLIIH
jgi:hypothetical protein